MTEFFLVGLFGLASITGALNRKTQNRLLNGYARMPHSDQ